jgi:hypothetical protein
MRVIPAGLAPAGTLVAPDLLSAFSASEAEKQ